MTFHLWKWCKCSFRTKNKLPSWRSPVDENRRIRRRILIRGSGSVPKCLGSATLAVIHLNLQIKFFFENNHAPIPNWITSKCEDGQYYGSIRMAKRGKQDFSSTIPSWTFFYAPPLKFLHPLYICYLWSRPACSNDVELVRLLAHTLEGLLAGQNQVDDS